MKKRIENEKEEWLKTLKEGDIVASWGRNHLKKDSINGVQPNFSVIKTWRYSIANGAY